MTTIDVEIERFKRWRDDKIDAFLRHVDEEVARSLPGRIQEVDREPEAEAWEEEKYPWWVNRVGGILITSEGLTQLFTPWKPSWAIYFYDWWLTKEGL